MEIANALNNQKKEFKCMSPCCDLDKIKSKFIFNKVFSHLQKLLSLKIIHYNKRFQKRLNIKKLDYKNYTKIEIELIRIRKKNEYEKFINPLSLPDIVHTPI